MAIVVVTYEHRVSKQEIKQRKIEEKDFDRKRARHQVLRALETMWNDGRFDPARNKFISFQEYESEDRSPLSVEPYPDIAVFGVKIRMTEE